MPVGSIEVISGPMFGGKTTQLIYRLSQVRAVGQPMLVFKPVTDTRDGQCELRSHMGPGIKVTPVREARQILTMIDKTTRVVALDEAQFFDAEVVNVCRMLADRGVRVIAAGLDMDYRRQPFGPMPGLLAIAESVTKVTALCSVCGGPAIYTQRLIDGKPAGDVGPLILVGGSDLYVARCRQHYNSPETGERRSIEQLPLI